MAFQLKFFQFEYNNNNTPIYNTNRIKLSTIIYTIS